MSVYTTHAGGFRDVAAEVADHRDEPLVTDLDEAGPGRVVVVDSPGNLTDSTLLALQQRLESGGPDRGGYSLVTGLEPEHAREFYFREPEPRDDHAIMYRKVQRSLSSPDEGTSVHLGDDASPGTLSELGGEAASLSLLTNGVPMHLFLNGGFICGFPSEPSSFDFDGEQPACVDGTEMDCPVHGDLVKADAMDVPHVFVNSCASLFPRDDLADPPVNVGLGLLRSATSLVGGYRIARASLPGPYLHYCLLRAGYDVVERCYLLTRSAESIPLKRHGFVPYGRPEASFHDPTETAFDVRVRREGDAAFVELADVRGHVVDLTLPPESAPDTDGRLYVRNHTEDAVDGELYYAAFEEGDAVRLLLYSWGHLSVDELLVEVGTRPVDPGVRERVFDATSNATALSRLGVLGQKGRGQLKDLRNRVGGLADRFKAEEYDANAHRDVRDHLSNVSEAVDQLRERLLDDATRHEFFNLTYNSSTRFVDVAVADEPCPYCTRPLYTRVAAHATGEFRRLHAICPHCGHLSDVPAAAAEAGPTPVTFSRAPTGASGAEPLTVEFTNPTDLSVDASIHPRVMNREAGSDAGPPFSPTSVECLLGPGETTTAEFELDASVVDPNRYTMSAFALANLDVYVGNAPLTVGDAVELIPPGITEDGFRD